MRIISLLRPVTGVILALALAGCSSNPDQAPLYEQLFAVGKNAVAAGRARRQPVERPPLTRAALNTVKVSSLEVTLERRDQTAYLFVSADRRDDSPGRITVWRTEDNVSLALRNGVLIATRGLGGDLVSSVVRVSGDRPGPAGSGEKQHFVRTGDIEEQTLVLACDLVDMGPDTIVIVERAHPTRHVQERCSGASGQVVNDYWVDPRAGIVWQSRQWAGPHIGYLRFRRLTK